MFLSKASSDKKSSENVRARVTLRGEKGRSRGRKRLERHLKKKKRGDNIRKKMGKGAGN